MQTHHPRHIPRTSAQIVLEQFLATTQAATEALRAGHEVRGISVGNNQQPRITLAPDKRLREMADNGMATQLTQVCNMVTGLRSTIYGYNRHGVRLEFEVPQ